MATLKDIAKLCETSTATVSYVLSGMGDERRISAAMQEKVKSVANELGYSHTPRMQDNHLPKITIYWPQKHLEMMISPIISGLNSALFMSSSAVEVNFQPYEQDFLSAQKHLWRAGSSDAAVIISASAHDMEVLQRKKPAMPTVLMNRRIEGYSSVSIDQQEAGIMAARHAVSRAGDDILLVMPSVNLYGTNLRGKAICEACRSYGVDLTHNIVYCSTDIEDGYSMGQRLVMENRLHKVIICLFDVAAIGITSALVEAGVKIGKDVEIISMNSSYQQLITRMYSGLTVVDLRLEEISTKAINLAIDFATKKITEPQEVVLHPQMIYRKSSPLFDTQV
jgi:DNA-binding LacI/PurR family transcriptional regulator